MDIKNTNFLTNFIMKNQFYAWYSEATIFLKRHPVLVIIRSDKGNVTVILYKEDLVSTFECYSW